MPEIPIREAFSSRQDAEAARDRLEYGGFARSRVQLLRLGDEFVVVFYAQPEEREHAQDLMSKTGWLPDWGRRMAEHAPTPGQTLIGLAAIAGAGVALYWALSQYQQGSIPRRLGLRENLGRGSDHSSGQETSSNRPGTVGTGAASSGLTSSLQPGGTTAGGGLGSDTRGDERDSSGISSAQVEVSDEPGPRTASGGD
jgi:hypothetical protein